MPRFDRRFTALDVIRMVENNLNTANKRLVFAWFFSTIPIKEPKVDVVGILLDLVGVIPVAGSFASLFQISLATAQVAVDIAELFKFEFKEEDLEVAALRFELESLRADFAEQRQQLLACQTDLDIATERIGGLLATQQLLEEDIEQLLAQIRQMQESEEEEEGLIGRLAERIRRSAEQIRVNARELQPNRFAVFIDNGALSIIANANAIIRRT